MARFLYTLALYLLLPYTLWYIWRRSRLQPEYMQHVRERFGRYGAKPSAPVIWIHAVSVGETRAAAPLIEELQRRHPGHRILLTHMTPTGRATGESLFGARVDRAYLPYDFPFAVARFLAHFEPVCGVLLETEIWPNLIHACRARDIPLYLVNARMSEKSQRGYARFGGLTRASLGRLAGIAAQTTTDAERLQSLGAPAVAVTGNLKFDFNPDPDLIARGRQWRNEWDARPVLLCASTREGEEAQLVPLLAGLDLPGLLIIIVPRHPQRFDEVAQLLERAALKYQRRSTRTNVSADTRILLGDSMGEMFAYYAASDVAIIGGSLLPFGAQNLIESCAAGCPVVLGPHVFNFADVVKLACEAGAAAQTPDTAGAVQTAVELLSDDSRRRAMSESARAFARAHRGASERIADLLKF